MAFAITPINVRSGRAQINGTNISVEDIQAEFKTDRVEVTGTEDQGATGRTNQNLTDAIDSMTANFTATVNADVMPSASSITQGTVLTNVKFFLDKALAPRYCGASSFIVLSVKYIGRLKDAWKFQVTGESTGGSGCTITHPT